MCISIQNLDKLIFFSLSSLPAWAGLTIPALKKLAIIKSVNDGINAKGKKLQHRFGMSDDDPENVRLIITAMRDCKNTYPDNRFFVINTHDGEKVKLEVFPFNVPVNTKLEGYKDALE